MTTKMPCSTCVIQITCKNAHTCDKYVKAWKQQRKEREVKRNERIR